MANTDVSTYHRLSSNTYSTNNELSIMIWDAGNSLFIQGGQESAAFAAALRGDTFFVSYDHDDAASDVGFLDAASDATVLFATDFIVELAVNDIAVVTDLFMGVASVSDEVHVEVVRWSGALASDAVAVSPEYDFHTGAAQSAADTKDIPLSPPIVVKQTEDTKVGFRVERNDGTALAVMAMRGFMMRDLSTVVS